MCETPLSAAISAIAGAIWGACVQYSLRLRGISSAWPVFKIVIFGRGPNPILSVKSPAVINPLFALSVRSMTLATPAKLSRLKSSSKGLFGKCQPGELVYVNPVSYTHLTLPTSG